MIQRVGDSDDNFLARLRENEGYFDFKKQRPKPEMELVQLKFISGLRDLEKKHRLPDGIKAKPAK